MPLFEDYKRTGSVLCTSTSASRGDIKVSVDAGYRRPLLLITCERAAYLVGAPSSVGGSRTPLVSLQGQVGVGVGWGVGVVVGVWPVAGGGSGGVGGAAGYARLVLFGLPSFTALPHSSRRSACRAPYCR